MKTIRISDWCQQAIRRSAAESGHGFDPAGAVRNLDGTWSIPIDDDVAAALEMIDPDPEKAIRHALGVPGFSAGRA